MVNSALKIFIGMLIISAVISAFHAVGIYTPSSTQQYHFDQQTWTNITSNSTGNSASAQQTYEAAAGDPVVEFLKGAIYVKGIIDPWCGNNWVIQIFTAFLQFGVIYFIGFIGVAAWVLNRTTGI